MDPALIVLGIRAVVRVSRTASAAYAQYVRDRAVLLPSLDYPPFGTLDFIRDMLAEPDERWRILGDGPLAGSWDADTNAPRRDVPGAEEALYLAAVQIFAQRRAVAAKLAPERGAEVAGEQLIAQWGKDEGPMRPLGRLVSVLADVALEFVGANPGVLGVGGNGEKLLGAFAANLAELIPDDAADRGPRSQFAEQVVGIVLRAGLDTLSRKPETVAGSRTLQQLVRTIVPPVVRQLPATLSEQSRWRDVVESLLGPAAGAAIATVAVEARALPGPEAGGGALGALTQAMLEEANRQGGASRLTEAGWVGLYRTALGLAVERPELFGRTDAPLATAQALFRGVGAVLGGAPPPFDGDLGGDVAVAALEAVRTGGTRGVDGAAWPQGVAALVGQVTAGIAAGLYDPASGPRGPLSRRQLGDLARLFVTQAARVPGLVAGAGQELGGLVETVARLIARDEHGLLAPDDWLSIASTAANEGLAQPGRLFDAAHGGPGVAAVTALLSAAAAADRTQGDVLFGTTLRDATVAALRAAAGSTAKPARTEAAIRDLAVRLTAIARDRPGRVGSAQWLSLFRSTVAGVIEAGAVHLDDRRVDALLSGVVAV